MGTINYIAVVVSAFAAFVASMGWYITFAKERKKLSPEASDMKHPQPVKMLFEVLRNGILASVIAYFVVVTTIHDWSGALSLGLFLWVGFPFILLTGSIVWEKVPWKLAAIHAGDWLIKIVLITLIIALWR